MSIERSRRIEAAKQAALMKERFSQGYLARWQNLRQWVVWKSEIEDEAYHKVPYNPGRPARHASIKQPESWGTLNQALAAYEGGSFSGIGFIVTPPFVLIDLDHSYNRVERSITKPEAQETIHTLNSATEASPNTGIHIYCQGRLPGRNLHTETVELYTNWFTTVTTDHIAGTPIDIQARQEQLTVLYERFAPLRAADQTTRGEVIVQLPGSSRLSSLPEEALNDPVLQRLLSGDIGAYGGDESRADYVLIMKLLHWTGDDTALTREIFLSSPLGQRKKATKRVGPTTYVDMTIRNAMRKRRNRPMDR